MSSIADRGARTPARPRPADRRQPTRASQALFAAKTAAFRLQRTLLELGRGPKRLARAADVSDYPVVVAQSTSALRSDASAGERAMQLGKVHNLRRAAMAFDGLELPAGAVFSFWRQLGKASRRRGFADGRMLQEGCMIPAIGGGLCQLSNALYAVAVEAGCEVTERHAHSRIVPGSAAAWGRDATVAWNYVDLRFASPRPLLLRVRLDAETLTVSLLARETDPKPDGNASETDEIVVARREVESCASCDETECFLHERPLGDSVGVGVRALLIDEAWPEFRRYVSESQRDDDVLCVPRRDGWNEAGFGRVIDAPVAALERSLAWRITSPQGPARRLAEARTAAAIARSLAARLGPEVTELVVAQSLLAPLWRQGWLGGRRFSVLMTRLPADLLQARLDAAYAAHPDRSTLADYRADPALVAAEAEALAAAESLITPHAEIADLFGARAVRLDWARPTAPALRPRSGSVIAFSGPTVARKGAYEVREAALRLGLAVRPLGAELEGADFWLGVTLDPGAGDWLDGVGAVVAPALADSAPRRLLAALAAGVPVIATEAAGLGPQPGLTLVPVGDVDALAAAISAVVGQPALDTATVSG